MKYLYEKILTNPLNSFHAHDEVGPVINCVFHVHSEFELVYVVSSFGTRFVGDNISNFGAGNLTMIGPMLPHHYYNSPSDSLSKSWGHARLLQFKEDFAGPMLFKIPEMKHVRKMLDAASYGIEFREPAIRQGLELFNRLFKIKGGRRVALFLELLTVLSESRYVKLSSLAASHTLRFDDRMDGILQFIHSEMEAGRDISLKKAASFASMSPEAFCRYFRRASLKGFVEYVVDQKIGKACGMLLNTSKGISEICYSSGFRNLSNFNRHFLNIKGMTPKEYRKTVHSAGHL